MDSDFHVQPAYPQGEVCLPITTCYGTMRQRLSEVYGNRIRLSLTSVPSYVIVTAVEYALSFAAALSARLLLKICHAPCMVASLKEEVDGSLSLTFSATPPDKEAAGAALESFRKLFADIGLRGGFTCFMESGNSFRIGVRLRRTSSAPTELMEALATAERDPFADALVYPL